MSIPECGSRGPSRGDLAPWFKAPVLQNNPQFAFNSMAGMHVLLLFAGSMGADNVGPALARLAANRDLFDDKHASFFGVTRDRSDVEQKRIAPVLPGIRWFLDFDAGIARLFGAVADGLPDRDFWLLLDPMMRVVAHADLEHGDEIFDRLRRSKSLPREEGIAPILIVPDIFEPGFCQYLIGRYEAEGGAVSGFMRDVDGKTVGIVDHRIKRRSDLFINDDEVLRQQIQIRLRRRLIPMIERFLNFRATRLERYVVACYDGDGEGGFFKAHRDNTTVGTAHRRFACTINLNADDYEGGDLVFPEFGTRRYRAPTGGAAVFSCTMLHEATPVLRGKRYAFLPFFYDEAAAQQREAIARSAQGSAELSTYRA